jgi:plastocyanin
VPNALTAGAATEVTVEYMNDSPVLHNVHFFAGPDATSETLAATELGTGPGNLQTTTFTTPSEPGEYFFHCDVHPVDMQGTLTVSQ